MLTWWVLGSRCVDFAGGAPVQWGARRAGLLAKPDLWVPDQHPPLPHECWAAGFCETFLRISLNSRVALLLSHCCTPLVRLQPCRSTTPSACWVWQHLYCDSTAQSDSMSPFAACAPLQGAITWLETQLKHSDMTLLMVTHDRTFMESVCTGRLMPL